MPPGLSIWADIDRVLVRCILFMMRLPMLGRIAAEAPLRPASLHHG